MRNIAQSFLKQNVKFNRNVLPFRRITDSTNGTNLTANTMPASSNIDEITPRSIEINMNTNQSHISSESWSHKKESFAYLLKNSKLMQLGDPEGRVVLGTVIEREGDDIYVDFGGKFYCVCRLPETEFK